MSSKRAALWGGPRAAMTESWRSGKYVGSAPPDASGRNALEASYLVGHFVLTLLGYLRFEAMRAAHGHSVAVYALAAWLLLSLCSLGRLADGHASGVALEWVRLLVLLPAALSGGERLTAAGASALLGIWVVVGRGWWVGPPSNKS